MPNVGDELHYFGWNACSSALCPYAPHPHVERRYLVVPGLRSSRIHIVDTQPDELARKAGYSQPHTRHCGPDGIYMSALDLMFPKTTVTGRRWRDGAGECSVIESGPSPSSALGS